MRSFAFVGIGLVLFLGLQFVLDCNDPNSMHTFSSFYALEDESVDVMIVGSSPVGRGWLAKEARRTFGFRSFSFYTSAQHPSLILPLVAEIKKTQHPRLWIVDLSMLSENSWAFTLQKAEPNLRRVVDNIQGAENRDYAIEQLARWVKLDVDAIKHTYPIVKYHSNWSRFPEILKYKFGRMEFAPEDEYEQRVVCFEDVDFSKYDSVPKLADDCECVCRQLCSYFKEHGDNVLFTIFPRADFDELTYKNYLAIGECIRQAGFPFIDLNLDKDVAICRCRDFSDHVHLNVSGAEKVTKRLCEIAKVLTGKGG